MTLLQEDLSGVNKENWQKQAEMFLCLVKKLYKDGFIYIDNQGIAMWKTSNKVIPQGYIDALILLDINFDSKKSSSLRKLALLSLKPNFKTRFLSDIQGNDKFWIRDSFFRVVERQQEYINGNLFVDRQGIVRWKTNNRVIPRECFEHLAYAGVLPRTYFEKNDKYRDKELFI